MFASWGSAFVLGDTNITVRKFQLHSMSDSISLPTLRRLVINTVNEHRSII